ncbi:MAG: N-6 DNA methylase [Rhodospirillales bacterium]|nr:N-6 DNA methylase [Rhodospirillales bacterium]
MSGGARSGRKQLMSPMGQRHKCPSGREEWGESLMALSTKQRTDFAAAVKALRETSPGKEATMYTALRDLFVDILGYPKSSIVVDTAGVRGRPDLTVYAPGGAASTRVSWIVMEAKAEPGAVSTGAKRTKLYAEKAKYITTDTAYFVMVDPQRLVARGTGLGRQEHADIEIEWATVTPEAFEHGLEPLRAEVASVPAVMQKFRDGDESLIACDRLSIDENADAAIQLATRINRNVFFDTLTETTRLLQASTLSALAATRPQREEIKAKVEKFSAAYGGVNFRPYPISVEGRVRDGREKDLAHRKDAALLRRYLAQQPALSRLALDAIPRFAERAGLDPKTEAEKIERFFANETANLILARILLIRFLEDHGFFDVETPEGPLRRRYLCNGGVAAFQGMRGYFDFGYTRLLEEAYRTGGHFYSAAFDETEMDWIIALSDADLSRTVEWSLFRMARFDFATARGDLMSGVYDRFLDRKQRKEQGEYYTPPTIARYILDRLDLAESADILDPACGSGTFLIERYRQVVGEDADRGIAEYAEARRAVESLYGNDLNPFSAVLSQIQLLWHLLAFGSEVKNQGFPDLHIAERANSLVPGDLYDPTQTRFGEIDRTGYAAVAGNPPYIRVERSTELESHAREYFTSARERNGKTFGGVTVGGNAYTLFIYRALDHWCRQPGTDGPTGKLGFIVPLAFCGSDEAADLRALFRPGARWAIREIVDLELIWHEIFDADVLPMILIAEAKPAGDDDTVSIRLADETCLELHEGAKRPAFNFDKLPEQHVRYADLFTPDGRIMTRLTPRRVEILKKLRLNGTFRDAAMPYWTKRGKGGQQVALAQPGGIGAASWEEQRLIRYGLATRREVHTVAGGGHTVFKGENITAARFTGSPTYEHLDVLKASSPSIWSFQSILPPTLYALPLIEQVPVAAPFNPATVAVLNTVVVFGPRPDLTTVPFDAVLLSSIYSYFYVLTGRRSFQNKIRSHIYPTAVGELPWNEAIAAQAPTLATIREKLLTLCERRFEQVAGLRKEAAKLGLKALKDLVRSHPGAKISFSDAFKDEPQFTLTVGEIVEDLGSWSVRLEEDGEHFIVFDDAGLAQLAALGLSQMSGDVASRTSILNALVPVDEAMAEKLRKLHASFDAGALDEKINVEVVKLDAIVGKALGLSEKDIVDLQAEMNTDPFLSRVRPRYPFFRPRQYGRRINLEREHRYATV